MDDKNKWNEKYRERLEDSNSSKVNDNLKKFAAYFQGGHAVDLACGLGGNSLYLAQLNYDVTALDISDVAVKHVQELADYHGLSVHATVCDLTKIANLPLKENHYDLVIITNYLQRDLFPILSKIVKENGLIFIETFYKTPNSTDKNDHMPEKFKLNSNELLNVFHNWQILFYEENEFVGKQLIFARKLK